MPPRRKPYGIAGTSVHPGERRTVSIPVASTNTHLPIHLDVHVAHGKKPGPTLLVCAAVHGDEINGVEIVRRLIRSASLRFLRGTLLAVPIANISAYEYRSRYMPDRRDLNRLFPGSSSGSLGSRLANVINTSLVLRSDAIVDLHTGAINRPNLPQVRVSPSDDKALQLAKVFNSPVTLLSVIRDASLRSAASQKNIPVLVYESGEALVLDSTSIRFGLRGTIAVMRHLEMLPPRRSKSPRPPRQSTVVCRYSSWERAPVGGLFIPLVSLGRAVNVGAQLGFVADPFGTKETPIISSKAGIVVGRTNEAHADEGDALFHIATASDPGAAESKISRTAANLPSIPADEDDHPVPFDPFSDVL